MNLEENTPKRIAGLVITLNLLWTVFWIWLFYSYHFTNSLRLFMYPDWLLIINFLIGLIGVYLGYRLLKNKISVAIALIIDIPLLLLGLIISYVMV